MKNNWNLKNRIFVRLTVVCVLLGLCTMIPKFFSFLMPTIKVLARETSMLSAGFVMPEGGEIYIKEKLEENNVTSESEKTVSTKPVSSEIESKAETKEPVSQEEASSDEPVSQDTSNMYKVDEVKLKNTGLKHGTVYVNKQTKNKTINVKTELERKPEIKIKKNSKNPQVLIVHTHTTESYLSEFTGFYPKDFSPRNVDKSQNIVRVGEELVAKLEKAGIKTVHATTYHDYPKYNGAYSRAEKTIAEYLKKYPSIEVVLDIHRDAMQRNDGTKVKPTATINDKKAAQVMIISGCDDEDNLDFPDWEKNMRFAVRLQKSMAEKYPGLARPILFPAFRYNMHMTKGSLIIEFGTDANTLDEAIYSAGMVGDCLVEVLNNLVVK